jgi:uncharacterized membrane protein
MRTRHKKGGKKVAEEMIQASGDITQDDKVWALLSWLPWLGWIPAIIALLIEPQKTRPFIRYNAVQALAASVVMVIAEIVLSVVTVCIGGVILAILWLAFLYPAIQAYQGEWVTIPFITDFCKNQGWI